MGDEPAKYSRFTREDRSFLRKMRISPDDLCPVCAGEGCLTCNKTGIVKAPEAGLREDDHDPA